VKTGVLRRKETVFSAFGEAIQSGYTSRCKKTYLDDQSDDEESDEIDEEKAPLDRTNN
jgi:hypothetical protein